MKKEFYWVGIVILVMWLVRIVDAFIPYSFLPWGVTPRTVWGLAGIPLMPFLHADFGHLFNNTFSLAILLALVVGTRKSPWMSIVATALAGGLLLWLVGRDANHVGASGLVFGLIGFLLVCGFTERSMVSVGVAILVGVIFGGTLLWGILPTGGPSVSWEGHFSGLLGGAGVAYFELSVKVLRVELCRHATQAEFQA